MYKQLERSKKTKLGSLRKLLTQYRNKLHHIVSHHLCRHKQLHLKYHPQFSSNIYFFNLKATQHPPKVFKLKQL